MSFRTGLGRTGRGVIVSLALLVLVPAAAWADPWMGYLIVRDAQIWPDGRPGNYGVVQYYIDESQGETVPITVTAQVFADGAPPESIEVQVFTNLNRRDHARVFESAADAGGPDSYYQTIPMTHVGPAGDQHLYRADLTVSKTGAYRLTARFRIDGGPWLWHNQFRFDGVNHRDLAIVVSPRRVLELTLYEVNPFVVEATPGGGVEQRSTFEDFTDHDRDGFDPFNLDYIRNTLGFNTIWLMPIFPNAAERWDPGQNRFVANHSPGSPYAARNYFAVDERHSDARTPEAAMAEFQHLVRSADRMGVNIFIDVAFNHAGRDVVFGQGAADLGLVGPGDVDRMIRTLRPAWATSGSNYREHASGESNIALHAPADRLGEHRWYDAGWDWFFGDYSSLGPKPGVGDVSRGGALDERDLFYTDLDPAGGHDFEVENVWNYFAAVLPWWLDRTDGRLAGIRADFAQGLPPRAWEYIINRTRQQRWDFVFLAEALDPDQVRYRARRTFDLVTTVDHWLYRNADVTMTQLAGSLEGEAALYGYNAAVLHNGTSHDEDGNGNVWLMTARYAVAAAMHGVPMVYMGQPLGVPHRVNFQESWETLHEYWNRADPAVFGMYRRINRAREAHPALRSTNRYFLHARSTGRFNDEVFSVARWEGDDIVLVFVNLRDRPIAPDVFAVPGAVPLDGSPGVLYQAVNLVADDPDAALWPTPRSAADIRQNGVYVQFGLPNEVQYLRLRRAN